VEGCWPDAELQRGVFAIVFAVRWDVLEPRRPFSSCLRSWLEGRS
jgi:hypothetical protein